MERAKRVEGCPAKGDLLCVEARSDGAVAVGSEARVAAASAGVARRCACASDVRAARAQAGTLSVFDARSWAVSARVRDAGGAGDAVTSLAFHPSACLSCYTPLPPAHTHVALPSARRG